jgi:hypothetical protein
MATDDEAAQAILDLIVETAGQTPRSGHAAERNAIHKTQAEAILKLAEAWAWLTSPHHATRS